MLVQVYFITTIHSLLQYLSNSISMNKNIGKLVLACGLLGIGYLAFTRYSKQSQKIQILTLAQTQKIALEIKYQMLTAAVVFATTINQNMERAKKQKHSEDLTNYLTTKMVEIYQQKQRLILDKYGLTPAHYKAALTQYLEDYRLKQTSDEIVDIVERCVRGELPNLEVDKKATYAFGKLELIRIYQDMSRMVLHELAAYLRKIKMEKPHFDLSDDDNFKTAVRTLNVFDKKINYLIQRGFKQEWGSPNEIFYKLVQTNKIGDARFSQQMTRLEQTYDKVVEKIAADPIAFQVSTIDSYYGQNDVLRSRQALTKSAIQPTSQKEQTFQLNKSSRSEPEEKENDILRKQFDDMPDEAMRS